MLAFCSFVSDQEITTLWLEFSSTLSCGMGSDILCRVLCMSCFWCEVALSGGSGKLPSVRSIGEVLGSFCGSLRLRGVTVLVSLGLVLKSGAAVRARAMDPLCPGEVLSLVGDGTKELFMENFDEFCLSVKWKFCCDWNLIRGICSGVDPAVRVSDAWTAGWCMTGG